MAEQAEPPPETINAVMILWIVGTLPTTVVAVVWYWRRLVARVWLVPPQPPLFSRRPPFFAKSPDDPPLRRKWLTRWCITVATVVFLLLVFHSADAARTWTHDSWTEDSQGLEPSYWVMVWYNILGVLILVPWSECMCDTMAGVAFLYARHRQLPLPNSRPNWLKERWFLSMCMLLLCSLAGLNTAYFWGSDTASVVEVQVPLARLPQCMDGLRLFLLSDTHAGPLVSKSHVERIVTLVNSLDPPIDIGTLLSFLPCPTPALMVELGFKLSLCTIMLAVLHTGDAAEGMPYARDVTPPAGMPEFAYPPALPNNRVVSQTLLPLKDLASKVGSSSPCSWFASLLLPNVALC